jgi:hypothetical protein
VINNRKGQVIDFQKMLAEYPDRNQRHAIVNDWGSMKHIWTVQKLWELLPDGFVLMESDILLKRSIDEFFREEYSVVGYHQHQQPGNKFGIGRMLPMLCWMNVPMLTSEGPALVAREFSQERDALRAWAQECARLDAGEITEEEYKDWKDAYVLPTTHVS